MSRVQQQQSSSSIVGTPTQLFVCQTCKMLSARADVALVPYTDFVTLKCDVCRAMTQHAKVELRVTHDQHGTVTDVALNVLQTKQSAASVVTKCADPKCGHVSTAHSMTAPHHCYAHGCSCEAFVEPGAARGDHTEYLAEHADRVSDAEIELLRDAEG